MKRFDPEVIDIVVHAAAAIVGPYTLILQMTKGR